VRDSRFPVERGVLGHHHLLYGNDVFASQNVGASFTAITATGLLAQRIAAFRRPGFRGGRRWSWPISTWAPL